MKRILILALGTLLFTSSYAQDEACWGETEDQKTLCREAYGIWQGDREQGSVDVAYQSWLKVKGICPPCVSEKLYTEGAKYFSAFMKKNKSDSVLQQMYLDSLLYMYDARIEYFPRKKAYVQGKYGTQLFKYRPAEYEKAQTYLKPSVDSGKEKSAASALQSYYYTIYKQYASAVESKDSLMKVNKKIELLKEFVRISDFVDGGIVLAKKEAQKSSYEKVRKNLLKIFLQVESDCESLLNLVKNNLVVEGDAESMKTAVTILTLKECTESDEYTRWVPETDDGTAKSAYSIGLILLKGEMYQKSLMWIELAATRCESEECGELMSYLQRAGQIANLNKETSKAKKYARQILDADPNSGDGYLILADAWSNSNCKDEKFGRACSYWVAYDYYAKAKRVDPSVAEKANKSMNSVRKGWPVITTVFQQGVEVGSSYNCCGVSTTVRTSD
jgi:tetratricopeptide (TPR) repeat protein